MGLPVAGQRLRLPVHLRALPGDAYLGLWPERDVIETPLDAVIDVNGVGDLAKTIRLIVKGNGSGPSGSDRRSSTAGPGVPRRYLAFADQVADRGLMGRHYRHVGLRQLAPTSSLKRFFYALRPAAVLHWLERAP